MLLASCARVCFADGDSEWSAVVTHAVLLGGGLCYGTGLMGYLCFRGATEGDILDNFSGGLASFFKILVVAHLVMYIPNEVRRGRFRRR